MMGKKPIICAVHKDCHLHGTGGEIPNIGGVLHGWCDWWCAI